LTSILSVLFEVQEMSSMLQEREQFLDGLPMLESPPSCTEVPERAITPSDTYSENVSSQTYQEVSFILHT